MTVDTASVCKDGEIDDHVSSADYQGRLAGYRERYPNVNQAKLVRKIDLRVVPMISILYLLAFLDRYVVASYRLLWQIFLNLASFATAG